MTLAPWPCKYLTVGTAARTLVSSVILELSSKGTFRSTLTNTLFPFNSASFKVLTLLLVAITVTEKKVPSTKRKIAEKDQNPDQGFVKYKQRCVKVWILRAYSDKDQKKCGGFLSDRSKNKDKKTEEVEKVIL